MDHDKGDDAEEQEEGDRPDQRRGYARIFHRTGFRSGELGSGVSYALDQLLDSAYSFALRSAPPERES
jgi:hypothetical protein